MEKISDILENIKNIKPKNGKISIGAILENNSENVYFLMILITIMSFLPFIFVIIFGSLDIYISYQILTNKKVIVLPKMINNISIKRRFLIKIIDKINPLIKKIESITKHRFVRFFKRRNLKILHIIIFALSIVITIPLPFSGTIPAIALLLLLLGILSKDGLLVLIGFVIGVVGLCVVAVILFLMRMAFLKLFS